MIQLAMGAALAAEPVEPDEGLKVYASSLAAGRIVIGLAPIVAPEASMQLLGFPVEHDNPTGRMVAGLFGTRDIALGAIVLANLDDERALRRTFLLNLCVDLADAAVISIPLWTDAGIDTGAQRSMAFALGGATAWTLGLTLPWSW